MGKNKTAKCIINEYIEHHTLTNTYNIDNNVKLPKINDNDMYNLIFNNYDIITKYNYTCGQLKIIAKRHKINSNGNKKQLIIRIYCFLYISFFIIKIQRCFRGNLVRLSHKLRGPAIMDRNMCINKQDFLNMDDLTTITYSQFFSYKDHDNFIYGFDIISLYNLISKSDKFINPYNRNKIPNKIVSNLNQLLKINSILNIPIITDVLNNDLPFTKSLNFKIIELFQNINSLGQYSDPNWFLTLSRIKLITFLKYLTDIWNYRAQISQETKNNICPPNGDIFRNINLYNIQNETNIDNIRQTIVDILCNLINRGINNDSRVLGSYYILGALTMVNRSSELSLPYLHQSFSFN